MEFAFTNITFLIVIFSFLVVHDNVMKITAVSLNANNLAANRLMKREADDLDALLVDDALWGKEDDEVVAEVIKDPKEKDKKNGGGNKKDAVPVKNVAMSCSPPALSRNLLIKIEQKNSHDVYLPGEVVQFECAPGYALTYEDALVCQPNGSWTGYLPVCLKTWSAPKIVQTSGLSILPKSPKVEISCLQSPDRAIRPRTIVKTECMRNEKPDLPTLWTSKNSEGKYTMAGKHARHRDAAGYYTCYCKLDDQTVLYHATAIDAAADLRFTQVPQDLTLYYFGQDVVLQCSAENALITWTREGEVLYYDSGHYAVLPNGALLILDIQLEHVGEYTCVAEHVRTKQKVVHTAYVNVKAPVKDVCGKITLNKKKGRFPRIFGGNEANPASHPWITYVEIRGEDSKSRLCGGSLVSDRQILSAAHCFYDEESDDTIDPENLAVVLGKHARAGGSPHEVRVAVETIYNHLAYNSRILDFDIAVLQLASPVNFTDYVRPICLPPFGFLTEFYEAVSKGEKKYGLVAGWGLQTNDRFDKKNMLPTHLKEVNLPLVPQDVCVKSSQHKVTSNMFCAGEKEGGRDSCEGDSGGPFEMKKGERIYLAGLVSFGDHDNCGEPGHYSFYTKVENFVDGQGDLKMYPFIG